jgi:hypothetical protein
MGEKFFKHLAEINREWNFDHKLAWLPTDWVSSPAVWRGVGPQFRNLWLVWMTSLRGICKIKKQKVDSSDCCLWFSARPRRRCCILARWTTFPSWPVTSPPDMLPALFDISLSLSLSFCLSLSLFCFCRCTSQGQRPVTKSFATWTVVDTLRPAEQIVQFFTSTEPGVQITAV